MLGLKYLAYRLTGSVALYSDALESIINVAASIAALVALRISLHPADANHPFGHSKAEYFSAVIEGVLIVLAALAILREAYIALQTPKTLEAPGVGLLISVGATLLNGLWAMHLIRSARRWRSPALLADGKHLVTDVISSIGVLIGLGLAWAALAAGTRRLAGRCTLLALPFAWVLLEWARNQGELAFPWGTLGYALLPTPLIQIADLGGVHLVSFLVTAIAAAIAQFGRDARPLGLVALLWLLAAGYGLTRPAAPVARLEVLLTQGAFDPLRRASGTQTGELEPHANLTRKALRAGRAALIVWPEGSVPVAPTDLTVSSALTALGTPAIIDALTFEGARRFNSA